MTSRDLAYEPWRLALSRRALIRSGLALCACLLVPRLSRAELVVQRGILGAATDAKLDADVIMTAAVVGHAFERLSAGKNCRFDFEVDLAELNNPESRAVAADVTRHRNVLAKLNGVLERSGLDGAVVIGVTPMWTEGGRIIGGTGDLELTDRDRYTPELPEGVSKQLADLAVNPLVGYQGSGAYTGFVAGRKDGQTGLMSTFRHNIPTGDDWGRRWHPPSDVTIDAAVGEGSDQRTWGMIGDNAAQETLRQQGMHFDGAAPVPGTDIVGYTHGMIQAVYDVVWRKDGTPYEIAVGTKTTKLASCFPCSVFMEATGFPASSTHLGKGASWAPLYPTAATTQHNAWREANALWYAYCRSILTSGVAAIQRAEGHLAETHAPSFAALQQHLARYGDAMSFANLILDALSVHDGEAKRIERTLQG